MWIILAIAVALVVAVAIYDVTQKKHAILRNFPIIGHFRYIFEAVGPELRQYIVTGNDEERPFSRDQRRWIYASSKKENNYFGFGTDNDLEQSPNYLIVKHAAFPLPELHAGEPGYDPGRHLGGVLYLYVRGMCGPETPEEDGHPAGVFSWQPPVSLVTALSGLLDGVR